MSLAPNLPSTTKKELLSLQNGNSHGRLPCPKQHRHRRRHRSPHGWNRQSAMVGTRWRNRLARGDWLQSVLGRDPPPCMTQRPNLPFTYLGHRGERRPPSSCPQRYRAQRCSSPTAIIGCVRGMGFHQRHRGFPPKRMANAWGMPLTDGDQQDQQGDVEFFDAEEAESFSAPSPPPRHDSITTNFLLQLNSTHRRNSTTTSSKNDKSSSFSLNDLRHRLHPHWNSKIKTYTTQKKLQTLLNKERISYITTNSHPIVTLIS